MMSKHEAQAKYAAHRRAQDAKVAQAAGLTAEQTDLIATICRVRHEAHSNWDAIWNPESANGADILQELEGLPKLVADAGLPELELPNLDRLPSKWDWELLTADEQAEWVAIGNEEGHGSGLQAWQNDGQELRTFVETMTAANSVIENWLAAIDERYGTHYAPTGHARMR